MELNKRKFAGSAAVAMGIIYLVCALFVAVWPSAAMRLAGWLMHILSVEPFAGDMAVTFTGFWIGLLQVLIYSYIGAYLFAWLFNRSVTSKAH